MQLSVTNPNARAKPVKPAEWKRMLADAKKFEGSSDPKHPQQNKPVVLDVRNSYEWEAGHFYGAERPQEDCFCETPVGERKNQLPKPLQNIDRATPVMVSI